MKTTSSDLPATSPTNALSTEPGPGRPSRLDERMLDALCSAIRHTGVSDSGAAARMSLHPSTLSRWKKESPSLAILLRAAREDFREAQLAIIEAATLNPKNGGRAAMWLLERVFPQDYAPRAAERAKFQELFEAQCARELEGEEIALPTELPAEGGALQNVKNGAVSGDGALERSGAARGGAIHVEGHVSHLGRALQNVKNPEDARAEDFDDGCPVPIREIREIRGSNSSRKTRGEDAAALGVDFDAALRKPLQNVKNSPLAKPFIPEGLQW